jgi:putative nucleotidyltransferase with HDIG domain
VVSLLSPYQAPTGSLAAKCSFPAQHQSRSAAPGGASIAPPLARGGVRRLLQEMRRDDLALYAHSLQVWALTQHLVTSLGYSKEEQASITRAALVHDVGKLVLPRTLLDTPMRLSPREYAVIQRHCATGAYLLRQRGVDEAITLLVYHHHERWDGQGYPEGLAGPAIPAGARLIAIADAFEAMTTPRPYQSARSVPVALQELERHAGTQFDPLLVQQCIVSLEATRELPSCREEQSYASTTRPTQKADCPGG